MEIVDCFFQVVKVEFRFPSVVVVCVTRPFHQIFQFSSFQSGINNFFHFVFRRAFNLNSFRQDDMLSNDQRFVQSYS